MSASYLEFLHKSVAFSALSFIKGLWEFLFCLNIKSRATTNSEFRVVPPLLHPSKNHIPSLIKPKLKVAWNYCTIWKFTLIWRILSLVSLTCMEKKFLFYCAFFWEKKWDHFSLLSRKNRLEFFSYFCCFVVCTFPFFSVPIYAPHIRQEFNWVTVCHYEQSKHVMLRPWF